MLEVPMIQTRGFRNRAPGEGFQVRIRSPYYRGIWTNLIEGATVTVDGEKFGADAVRWQIDGADYSPEQLRESPDGRWPVDVPAVLSVPRRRHCRSASTMSASSCACACRTSPKNCSRPCGRRAGGW
jgi:hypothetical protein